MNYHIQNVEFNPGFTFDMDVTNKPSGERTRLSEVALYTVANGKIVEEQFLYLAD